MYFLTTDKLTRPPCRAGPTSKLILREMEEIRRQEAAPKFQ